MDCQNMRVRVICREAATGGILQNKVFLKTQQYSQKNTFRPATLLKRDPNAGASCEYCENFKNTYFEEHLRTTASVCIVNLPLIFSVLIKTKMSSFSFFFNLHLKRTKCSVYLTNLFFLLTRSSH